MLGLLEFLGFKGDVGAREFRLGVFAQRLETVWSWKHRSRVHVLALCTLSREARHQKASSTLQKLFISGRGV